MAKDAVPGSLRFTSLPLRKLRVARMTVEMTMEKVLAGQYRQDEWDLEGAEALTFKALSGTTESNTLLRVMNTKIFADRSRKK
jgi:hypothetical protein